MKRASNSDPQAGIEDILLTVLGLVAGPLLWWISESWRVQPAATSMQTLEHWIALLCGFIGVALSLVWCIFFLASLVFIIGIRTHHVALTYWSELFTPKFLRRLVISIVGTQLTLASQAVASPEVEHAPEATSSVHEENAFMPYVETPSSAEIPETAETTTNQPSTQPSSDFSDQPPSPTLLASQEAESTLSPKARETNDVVLSPITSPSSSDKPEVVPTPRQTSTILVENDLASDDEPSRQPKKHRSQDFTPKPTPLSQQLATPRDLTNDVANTLVVKVGDCLWDIAHFELGADATLVQIDNRWRQWWEYNFRIIGDDPNTLQPGTILEIPPFTD